MKPKIIYLRRNGEELHNPTKREIELVSRRQFIRRSTLFLPLSFFAGSIISAKATSIVINRTISAGSQNAAQMLNSSWARPVILPSGWNTVRVGARFHFTNVGANLTGTTIFALGFCSGTTLQYGSATTLNFIGMAWSTTPWTYVANAGNPLYQVPVNGSMPVYRTRVGTTNTDSAVQSGGGVYTMNAGASLNQADRQIQFVDVSHGSPNYSVHCPFTANLANNIQIGDVSAANFLNYMGQTAPAPSEGQYQTTSINTGSLAFSESVNPLNAINFYWNHTDVAPEICDVAVALIA